MTEAERPFSELLAAIRDRDLDRLESCFAADARLRVLTPKQVRDLTNSADIRDRYRTWLALDPFEVLEGDVTEIGDRVRVRYRFRGRDPEKGWQLNEHTGYGIETAGRISALNVTCTGFRPTQAP